MESISVTFYSNFLNNHQIPFCNQMERLLGDNFRFVATEKISVERIKLGFRDVSKDFGYAINAYESRTSYDLAMELGINSDVVIIGSAPDVFIKERIKRDKLTFRYYERFFKKGKWRIIDPRVLKSCWVNHTRHRNKRLYMLCASAYTSSDCDFIFAYPNKTYRWGYFTGVKKHNIEELLNQKPQGRMKILWAGRFILLKHPEKAIMIVKRLLESGNDVELDMIGYGEMENYLRTMVSEDGIESKISFLGSMPPEQVLERMEKANIFLFTSDRQEGWGAVLNESMSSGCAVVASDAIGSVPFLIQSGENGFSYKNDDIDDFYQKVELLVKNKTLREKLSQNACLIMQEMWNAENASKRFVEFAKALLQGKLINFADGPCSKA